MKIENAWTVLLISASCSQVSVHGFTGSERGRGIAPPFVGTGSISSAGSRHAYWHQTKTSIVRPLQESRSNHGHGGLFGDDTLNNNKNKNDPEKVSSSKPKALKAKSKQKRFAVAEELKQLRADLDALRENVHWAEAMEDADRVADLKRAIQNGEERDPDLCYAKALQILAQTKATSLTTNKDLSSTEKQRLLVKWQKEAELARSCLPQFQLEGLWVGNYGDHGNELINVTYVGDTMLATKTTGDVNVPRGEISFSANFFPRNASTALEPLKLSFDSSSSATSSSATARVPRFTGKGQIAKPGFTDHKYVDGQLILFERQFSFVWLPTKHHVLFRRPTPEQTIEMLRDVISKEDEIENMREHVTRCFDMDRTESLARQQAEQGTEPFRRIASKQDLEEWLRTKVPKTLEPKGDSKNIFNFWGVDKWRQYIDGVLRDDNSNQEMSFW